MSISFRKGGSCVRSSAVMLSEAQVVMKKFISSCIKNIFFLFYHGPGLLLNVFILYTASLMETICWVSHKTYFHLL